MSCVSIDHVRLLKDIPELGLRRGQIGAVCSTWFSPAIAYEVEFEPPGEACTRRVLLLVDQIEMLDSPSMNVSWAGTGAET